MKIVITPRWLLAYLVTFITLGFWVNLIPSIFYSLGPDWMLLLMQIGGWLGMFIIILSASRLVTLSQWDPWMSHIIMGGLGGSVASVYLMLISSYNMYVIYGSYNPMDYLVHIRYRFVMEVSMSLQVFLTVPFALWTTFCLYRWYRTRSTLTPQS